MSLLSRKERILSMLESEPENDFLLFAYAKELENKQQAEDAIATYHNLLKLHPNYVGAYYHLGKLKLKNNDQEGAILILSQGISVANTLKDLHALAELKSALNEIELDDLL